MTHRIPNRRPSTSVSDTKSRLQRWFGPCGIAIGARVPSARLRPPRLRTASRSSDRPGRASSSSHRRLHAAAGCAADDSQSGSAQPPKTSTWSEAPHHLPASTDRGTHADRDQPGHRPGAASTPCSRWPSSRRFSSNWASEVFSQHLAQSRDIQHRFPQQLFQLGVLLLQRLQTLRLRHLRAAIFAAPLVEGYIADPVLVAQFRRRQPGSMLLQYPDNLLFAEPRSLHYLSPLQGTS